MQSISPLSSADLRAKVQRMAYKFEVYDGAAWVDLCEQYLGGVSSLADWAYRKRITLPVPDENLTDFPNCIKINADADLAAALANGHDIRFTAADGVTLLPYERESWAGGGGSDVTAIFWVKTSVATAGTYIWCYYGNAAAADGQNVTAVWDANFKAVYHMKDATTSTILDSTANDNDGTKDAANQPVEADGKVGKGQDFNSAANENIDIADDATLDGTAALAISAWIKPETNPAWATLAVKGTSTIWDSNHYTFGILAGRIAGRWNGKGTVLADAGDALSTGSWQHVAFVVEAGTTNALKVYKNGTLIKQGNRSGDPTPNASVLRLGSDSGAAGGDHLNGVLDEVRVSSIARSAAWIAYEYANMNPADGGLTWGAAQSLKHNLLKSVTVTPSGAGPTPEIIAGTWSAEIKNPDGIFHPLHPTSAYKNYFRIGRQVRISIGGVYGGTTYYWQRLIGYMDAPQFDHKSKTVSLGGCDYSKRLADFILRDSTIADGSGNINGPLHWGVKYTTDSQASDGTTGSELYTEVDAISDDDADSMATWATGSGVAVSSVSNGTGGYCGQFIATSDSDPYAQNTDCGGSLVSRTQYLISFRYRRTAGTNTANFIISQSGGLLMLRPLQEDSWTTITEVVTANTSGAFNARIDLQATGDTFQIDDFTIKEYNPTWYRYQIAAASNGPYFVTLDGEPVWQGERDKDGHFDGWLYDDNLDQFLFDEIKSVPGGSSNLIIYYYTTQTVENVVADILVHAGLYADRATALAAMDYTATGITIPRVWFEAGSSAIDAIRMLCERANYRFWFTYDGTPTFQPAPTMVPADFGFSSFGDLAGLNDRQNLGQLRNRIVIEGSEMAVFQMTRDDKRESKFLGESSDATSISAYLEHTESIQNHLFQDQAALDAMCVTLLAERKDPKWYVTFQTSFLPVPVEIGDTVSWKAELSSSVTLTLGGVVRAISLTDGRATYTVEIDEDYGDWSIVAEAGAYAVTGQAASLERGYALAAEAGSYGVAGQDAALTHAGEYTFDTDDYFVVPAGVTSIEVEAWGQGGYGGARAGSTGGGGAGGGAYSRSSTISVTPTETLDVLVGDGGNSTPDKDTELKRSTTALVRAASGDNAVDDVAGVGGLASAGIGDTKYSGGNGANASGSTGGGGGSSAGTGANGTNASGQAGGLAPAGGGDGGDGGSVDQNGGDGTAPGGAGGGSGGSDSGSPGPGYGAHGWLIIRYSA